jgi:hypothetical protein
MIKDAVANHIPRDETVDGECVAPTGMNRGKRRLFQFRYSERLGANSRSSMLLRIYAERLVPATPNDAFGLRALSGIIEANVLYHSLHWIAHFDALGCYFDW